MSKRTLLSSVADALGKVHIFADAGNSEQVLANLRQELINLANASQALVAKADEEGRDLEDTELEIIKQNKAKIAKIKNQIEARESLVAASAPAGRQAAPASIPAGAGGRDNTPKGNAGFLSFGEFAMKVRDASRKPHEVDQRLLAVQTVFGNEAVGADGGWAVPQTWRTTIWQKVMEEENLLTRCTPLVTSSNNITIPKDETTPWGNTGIQVYWEAEGAQATPSKPVLGTSSMRLVKLMGLVPMSEEVMDDAPGMESYIMAVAPGRMTSKVNEAIISGTGAGQPLGILNSPSIISVAKETSQPADTIWAGNINKLYTRMYAPNRARAVWLVNPDLEGMLDSMAFPGSGVPATGSIPVYMPPGGLSAAPYGTLKGRPVIPCESCPALGNQGDIIFADLSQYWYLTKGGGVQTDVSMHLYFDQALLAFRFIFRINGQPIWSTPITMKNTTASRSWAVTLDERA